MHISRNSSAYRVLGVSTLMVAVLMAVLVLPVPAQTSQESQAAATAPETEAVAQPQPQPQPQPQLQLALAAHIQKDPIAAGIIRIEDLAGLWDQILSAMKKFIPEDQIAEVDQGLQSFDQQLGISLRNDLLAHLGPEMGISLDAPPIDMIAGLVMAESPEGLKMALSRIGVICQVREREQLNRVLWGLFKKAGATIDQEGTLVRLTFVPDADDPELEIQAFYGFKGNIMAIGFSPEWVNQALVPALAGRRFDDGADLQRVLPQLDADATGFAYLNLPKLRDMVQSSQMVQGAIASDPEIARVAGALLDQKVTPVGLGISMRQVGDGSRRVVYGPSWFGGSMQLGILAGIAVPNLTAAIERGRQKRTMADMRTIGTCIEAFAVDNNVYPTTNNEWINLAGLADQLEGFYIKTLPARDGWGEPFRIRSDGTTYIILSRGKDGLIDRDWSAVVAGEPVADAKDDIVYNTGIFVNAPGI